MAGGNLALAGWSLSRDSFWTSEALCYLVATAVAGVHAWLLRVVPALLGAAIVLLGCASAGAGRRPLGALAGSASIVAVLAIPGPALSSFFLQSGFHVGTAFLCLACFALLASGRLGWNWVVAVVLLTLALLGDLQAAAFGLAPLAAAGVAGMLRRRNWWAGLPELSAAGASVLLAVLGRELADRAGTFGVNTGNPTAPLGQMLSSNLHDLVAFSAEMLGLPGTRLASGGVPGALAWLHVLSVAALLVALLGALAGLVRGAARGDSCGGVQAPRRWWLDDVLVLAALADVVVFLRLDEPAGTAPFARYLSAAVVFATVLLGRSVARATDRLAERAAAAARPGRLAALPAALALTVLGAYAAGFAVAVGGPAVRQPAARLAAYLEAHHLENGLGDYWTAALTTVESGGRVRVRPVIDAPDGTVQRYERQSDASWYRHRRFGFVVYDAALPLVTEQTVAATFGAPEAVRSFGPYRVVVLSHPVSIGTAGVAG